MSVHGTPLPGFLQAVAPYLDHYGVGAVAALVLLENIGVPVIPGETALIAAAVYAGTGRLNVVAVGVSAVIAAFAGAEIGYGIGWFGGRALVLRYGRYVRIKPHHVQRAEGLVDRYGGAVVVVFRFIVGLREANGILCGVIGMRWWRFALYNLLSALLWVGVWVTAGYLAGSDIGAIYAAVSRYALYLLIGLAVLAGGYLAWRVARRRRPGAATSNPDATVLSAPDSAKRPGGCDEDASDGGGGIGRGNDRKHPS